MTLSSQGSCSARVHGGANRYPFATCKSCTCVAGSAMGEPPQRETEGAEDLNLCCMCFAGFTPNQLRSPSAAYSHLGDGTR